MWHELAHHLGGRTVAEWKQAMSAAEFGRWIRYFNKNGRCTLKRLYDLGAAKIMWKIDHAMCGAQTEIKDYLPQFEEPDIDMNVNEQIRAFGGAIARG